WRGGVAPRAAPRAPVGTAPAPPSWTAARGRAIRGTAAGNSLAVLWTDASVRRTFLLWTVASIALQFGYYGANSWLPSYLVKDLGVNVQSMGLYVAGTYTMMVIGK